MAFKGFKKTDSVIPSNHFETIKKEKKDIKKMTGRPLVNKYQKQDKRIQFYVSQEMIDILQPIAIQNGCKDITAYAKKILINKIVHE